ncbi:ATP-binding protein [Hamadaea tsunoensis]|uniref:ATP-binding protein n=1 Tax=Hamadaea tsunoensis TaxID=53368 RepID=UPI0003FD1571|nr:ATP-binding protein [Hamadaea tsunoensis]
MIIGVGGLTVGFTLGTVALTAILAVTLGHSVDDQARTTARDVADLVDAGSLAQPVPVAGPSIVQVVDDRQRVRASSPAADGLVSLLRPQEIAAVRAGQTLTIDGDRATVHGLLHVIGAPAGTSDDPLTVVVALPVDQALKSVSLLRSILFVVYPVLVGGLSLLAWRVVGIALRPVEDLRAGAERIAEGGHAERLPVPDGADEVHRLAVTLNHMLDRQEAARQRQREFVADAAHELRSPIANLRVQLEVAEHAGVPVPAPELLADVERLTRLTDDLLLLARNESAPARLSVVEVHGLLAEVAGRYSAARVPVVAPAAGSAAAAAVVRGDPVALDRLLANLVDNAVRYAATAVTLSARVLPGAVEIVVADDGPGVPAADRERVFERFTRLDDARSRDEGGTGLGLAIVREIARRHHGDVTLAANDPGVRAIVTLPLGGRSA